MNFDYCTYSEIGDRDNNEDSIDIIVSTNSLVAVVADGLGGYSSGEIASRIAVDTIKDSLESTNPSVERFMLLIERINTRICEMQKAYGKMMSTIAVLWIDSSESRAVSINIGDSRIYQFRDGELIYQSIDHSVAQMAVLTGEINKSDIRTYPRRNELVRALGASESVKSEISDLDIKVGDIFLVCTDGLWELVTEEMMINTLHISTNMQNWVLELSRIVRSSVSKKKDNNSAIAIKVMD